jgi:hypothetical protein
MTHHPGTREAVIRDKAARGWTEPLRGGTNNKLLCRFFTWFWFARENRWGNWPTKVVWVLGPSTFRVERSGDRRTVWLRGPGCYGYEYGRQVFILLGEWLRRFEWFRQWNRSKCSDCGHDKFEQTYHDTMQGLTCEYEDVCTKCRATMYEFSYGAYAAYVTTEWERYETLLFGSVEKASD